MSTSSGKSSPFFPAVMGACLLAAGIHLFSPIADMEEIVFDGLLLALGLLFLAMAVRNALKKPVEPVQTAKARPRGLFGIPVERRQSGDDRRKRFFRPSLSQHGRDERRRHSNRRAA